MKITAITIKRFREWIQDLINRTGIDPALLGLTTLTDENIKQFLIEHCKDLTYSECKDKILEMYPILKTGRPIDEEAIAMAQQMLQEYYGTPYISEAFKEFVSKYSIQDIQDMIMNIKNSPLEIFLDYCKGKYGAEDIDVRGVYELGVYGIKTQVIHQGNEQLFFNQMIAYQGYRQAKSIYQLISYGENIMIAHKNIRALVLIAIIDSDENIILPVTQSDKGRYMVVLNNANKRGALVY